MKPTRSKSARRKLVFGAKSRGGKLHRTLPSDGAVNAEIPNRWVWHYETLSSLRERLIQERKERLGEVAQPKETHSTESGGFCDR